MKGEINAQHITRETWAKSASTKKNSIKEAPGGAVKSTNINETTRAGKGKKGMTDLRPPQRGREERAAYDDQSCVASESRRGGERPKELLREVTRGCLSESETTSAESKPAHMKEGSKAQNRKKKLGLTRPDDSQ